MTLPGSPKCSCSETPSDNCTDVDEDKSEFFTCDVCKKKFRRKGHLRNHIITHNAFFNSPRDKERRRPNTCAFCFKKFTAKKNLLKHLRNIHKKFREAEQMLVKKIKCPQKGCKFICRMMKDLRFHIEEIHNVKILKDTLQFANDEGFQKWKKEEECNTVSWFVTGRKKTTLMNGSRKQIFYCHRTGQYISKSFGKYRMRSVGSCKIGMTCPASMELTEFPDGHCTVIYYKTHLGHVQDVVYLKLSKEEKMELVEKIQQGFSFDAILEDVKENTNSKESKKKRIHMLSKKDLYRIMRRESEKKIKMQKTERKAVKRESIIEDNDDTLPEEISEAEKDDERSQHGSTVQPADKSLPPQEKDVDEKSPPCQKTINTDVPLESGEGIVPQAVVPSPEVKYSSVAKLIIVSDEEKDSRKTPTRDPVESSTTVNRRLSSTAEKLEQELLRSKGTNLFEFLIQEKIKSSKPNLSVRIKEKLGKITEVLPKSQYLTPSQFNLICAKLDGVLDIFNTVKKKAKVKKLKKKLVKKKPVKKEGIQSKRDDGV